jgi:capsule polysaccharide export protein KpsE/RkpR
MNDPYLTAEMANYVVLKLDEINRELSTEQARYTRKFIEERLRQARNDLQQAEDTLNSFQNAYGVISISEQTKAAIEIAAQLHAQITTTETEYNVKKRVMGSGHPDLMRLESELVELRKKKYQMEFGGDDTNVFIPFKAAPDLGLQYFRLYREVQISNKVVEYLVPQYEQAKVQEAKDTPTLLVLDKGQPAAYPFKPRKKIVVLAAGLIVLVFWGGLALGLETLKKSFLSLNFHRMKR